MRLRAVALLLCLGGCALCLGCGGPSVQPYLVALVTPSGGSPLAEDGGVTHVVLVVKQGVAAPQTIDEDVVGGTYVHDVDIVDFSALVSVRATLTTPSGPLIGAPPDFSAGEAPVSVPVGPPSTCAVLAGATFATARGRPSAAPVGSFGVVTGEDGEVEFFDGLRLQVTGDDTPGGWDGVRLVGLLPRTALLASFSTSDALARYAPQTTDTTHRTTMLSAPHAGAHAGTPLSLDADGAVVLGGETAPGVAVDGVTFVGTDGALDTTTHLATPRIAPAAARVAGRILVAGGLDGRTGAPVAELVARGVPSVPIVGPDDGVRRGGALFVDGAHAMLVGGTDASGAPVATTVRFDCSTGTCVATPGPPLDDPRAGATALPLASGGLLLGGLAPGPVNHLTRVRFDSDGTPRFEALHLAQPRATPAAYALPSGVVYVFGGVGPDGPRTDVEVCFPDALVPL